MRPCPTSDFDAVFSSGFVSSSSTRWDGQNTILTTFIFEQRSNTTLNQKALIPFDGAESGTGDVLIFAHRRVKDTETQYLTWFGKLPTSTGEVHFI